MKWVVKYSLNIPAIGEKYSELCDERVIFTRIVEAKDLEEICKKLNSFVNRYFGPLCNFDPDLMIHRIERLEQENKIVFHSDE